MAKSISIVTAAIEYIEAHLDDRLDLESLAKAVNYSKYHLHRLFTSTLGLTIHDYIKRRRLTEAAKLLVFSQRPIMEIALLAGYETQQSFTDAFKAMYKTSPGQFREAEEFYPLQFKYILKENPASADEKWREKIRFATLEDIPAWMDLVRLVIDGFPHLDEADYLKRLRAYIRQRQALILMDADTAIGVMAFHENTGSIDFLGVHPQYRNRGIAKAFCDMALYELAHSPQISVTTFRSGDKADTGQRALFGSLGFAEAELMVEFGYPTQRLILKREKEDA